uniref:Uncharacterized protein n=1 Tax=Anopheles atroparvus TaxID=41427 RepID=A0A182J769_ANOAO
MAKLKRNTVKGKTFYPKKTVRVFKKKGKPAGNKNATGSSQKKKINLAMIDAPRAPLVFLTAKAENPDDCETEADRKNTVEKGNLSVPLLTRNIEKPDDDDETDEDEMTVDQLAPRPAVLEPVPTDVPDPGLPPALQKLIRRVIAFVYNVDQMTLKRSFEEAGLLLEPDYDEQTKVFRFLVNTKEICSAVGEKQAAHTEARVKLVQIIRYYCYTVKRVKEFHTRRKIFHTRPPNPPKDQPSATAIKEENIGFKMLQKQGWSGGALGTNEDGILEPIAATMRKGKAGLGTENATKDAPDGERPGKVKIPLEAFYMMMKQYAGVNALYDLVFSTQFTKPQVAKLKAYATSLKLFPQFLGEKKPRRLIVSRPLTIQQIKLGVMRGHSDLCAKYVVIPPAAGIPEEDKMIKPNVNKKGK